MAVIRCTLEEDGRLKVLEVIEFQPGDTIRLDEPVEVAWQIPKHPEHSRQLIAMSKCLAVKTAFAPEELVIENVIPVPCPGN